MKSKLILLILFFVVFTNELFSQGNTPCTAAALPINSTCTYQAGTTVGATTNNDGFPAITCGTGGEDVWYTFTPTTSGSHTISSTAGTITDGVMQLYSATLCNGTGVEATIACSDDAVGTMPQITANLTAGTVYYVRFWDYGGGTGTFNICLTGPPVNDNCSGAILLTSSGSCSATASNTNSGFTDGNQGCSTGTEDDDAWFSFVAVATTHTVLVNGGANFDAVLGAYNSCGGGQPAGGACVDATAGDGNETITLTGLTIGNTYLISVHDYAAGGGDFTICVTHASAPSCATYTAPLDGAEFCGSTTTLTWAAGSGSAPTSYILYYGTDNPPTNIVNGVNIGNVTSYPVAGLVAGTSYFWQIIPTNAQGNATNCAQAAFTSIPCVNITNGSSTTCSSSFYDSGGPSGSASDNEFFTYTFCPAIAGQCVQSTFYTFNTESSADLLYVYDGNSVASAQLPGSPFSGNLGAFAVVGTSSNATGCLTFRYDSDNSVNSSGWDAAITCAPCGTTTLTAQDCAGAIPICNDASFSANSLGDGIINDINGSNQGCLSVEHQSSWYYFQVATGGTIQLDITPANGVDDYDFAIYSQGMATSLSCPPPTTPYRCSYSSLGGITGLDLTAGDNSEGVGGDKWVEEMVVVAGEVYVMVIDNYSVSSQPFTLDWTFTNGATLDCTPLPTELVSFNGKQNEKIIELEWTTATEVNNDYFIIEKSINGIDFVPFKTEDGAGLSTQILNYILIDENPFNGKNYYRLSQVDYNGNRTQLSIISVDFKTGDYSINNLHPNPTNGEMYFDFYSTSSGSIKLEIIDITGRIVTTKILNANEGKNSYTAPSNEISNGVYYMKIDFENGKYLKTFKIIKE